MNSTLRLSAAFRLTKEEHLLAQMGQIASGICSLTHPGPALWRSVLAERLTFSVPDALRVNNRAVNAGILHSRQARTIRIGNSCDACASTIPPRHFGGFGFRRSRSSGNWTTISSLRRTRLPGRRRSDLFAAPDLVAEKLGRSFQLRARSFGGISQIETSLAQRVINQSGVFALFERVRRGFAAEQIAGISITPVRDHESEGNLVIENDPRVIRLRIFQMPGSFRGYSPLAVAPGNAEQIPGVDGRIQIDQRGISFSAGSGSDMNGAGLPELLQF
jgi:hypothetical protein